MDKQFVFCFGKIVPGALTSYQPSWQQRYLTCGENSVQLPYN